MPSHPIDFQFQANIFSTEELAAVFDEEKRLQRWLDFEAALAESQAELGIIPAEAARAIGEKAKLALLDKKVLRDAYRGGSNSIVPLLNTLRRAVGPESGEFIHFGATTQDVLDTALILEQREVFLLLERDLRSVRRTLLALTRSYRKTPMIGRTHGQQALPITFGLKTAGWLAEIDRHLHRLYRLAGYLCHGQLAGAVGTMAALGELAFEVAAATLRRLGLVPDTIGWHTSRDRLAEIATFYAICATTCERIAGEIFHLARTEIGELAEAGSSSPASSTMPHKSNPVRCQRVGALARHVRALTGVVIEAGAQEHERDASRLWAEWLALPQISIYTGTAVHYLDRILSGLRVAPNRMLANLRQHGELVVSEKILFHLAPKLGKMQAHQKLHQLIGDALRDRIPLKEKLLADPELAGILNAEVISFLDEPERYTGHAEALVDRLLQELDTNQPGNISDLFSHAM